MGKSRFLIAILLLCTSSAGADEIGIPAIESGLEITPIASSTSFALTLEYSLQRHKAQLEPGEYRVTLPIPSSDESQRVTISKVTGFEIGRIARDYHGLARVIGLGNELLLLEIFPRCSLLRTESRGSHFRVDYPERDDTNWLKWVVAKQQGDGIKTWTEPIPFKEFRYQPSLNK